MNQRKILNERRKLKRLEQVVRSKIWGELAAQEQGGSERKKLAEERIAELKKSCTEEKMFQNEQVLSEYRIALIDAYVRDWPNPKVEELLYFHLTNYLTEEEKFAILN